MATLHDFQTFISARGETAADWASWTKSSCASVRPRPNASQSSISQHTTDTMQLLNILYPTSAPSSMYRLSQVIGDTENGHRYSCVALEKWIHSKTNIIIGSGSREEVQNGPTLPPPTRDDPLWISPLKYPDVSLWCDNEVTLQIEVVSNYDLEKTINKLCLGLIPQHRSWKNRLSSISYCRVHISCPRQQQDSRWMWTMCTQGIVVLDWSVLSVLGYSYPTYSKAGLEWS